MSARIGNRIVRSLPEQVAENSRRIDAVEEVRKIVVHNIHVVKDDDNDVFNFQIINKSEEPLNSYPKIYEALLAIGDGKTIMCSGYSGTYSLPAVCIYFSEYAEEVRIAVGDDNNGHDLVLDEDYWSYADTVIIL